MLASPRQRMAHNSINEGSDYFKQHSPGSLQWARRGSYTATTDALAAAGVGCSKWDAALREPTEGSLAAAAAAAAAARATRGAKVFPHATEAAWVATLGPIAVPLPAPETLPGPGNADLSGDMPTLEEVRSWAGLPDAAADVAYDAAVAAAAAALADPEFVKRRKAVAGENAFVMFSEVGRCRLTPG